MPTGAWLAALLLLALAPNGAQEERRVFAARTSSPDTLAYETAQTNLLLEGARIEASPRTAVLFFDGCGAHRGTVLRDLLVHVAPGTLPLDRAYWGVRGYDMVNTVIDHVEITGFGRVTDKHDEGHALYLNLAGDLALVDSYVHGNGGQGLQLVNRPLESSLPPGPAAGTILLRRTRFHENGFNPDRGASCVSIFGTGQDVLLEDVEIVAGFDAELWPQGGSRGALLIEPEPWAPERGKRPWWRPAEPPEDFTPPYTQGTVELRGLVIRHRAPDRPLMQIKGCETLIVRGCTFEVEDAAPGRGRIELDLPSKPGRNCGRIVWEGNRGNALVYVRGRAQGPADQDFVLE